ncbi:hypothetical protein HMPREF1624_08339 [Sporothrix schenckii ATCC 58251]|uniref:Uncharacterized protein n=1 Tax=Sporothrix schenckii (strain ATCC 58251 / de Perez 2211183) TaxID=1391915 RepID=U7PK69_SPOS1|nr:hypothetical protein HMPREF1624_08339 [Sporothrix schenckii ATCC 58251]
MTPTTERMLLRITTVDVFLRLLPPSETEPDPEEVEGAEGLLGVEDIVSKVLVELPPCIVAADVGTGDVGLGGGGGGGGGGGPTAVAEATGVVTGAVIRQPK